MRSLLVFSLFIGFVGTLSAEAPPKASESDLARAYYQAAKANDFGEADAAFQELSDRFPDDDLTKLVADHWNRRLKEEDPKSWKNISSARSKSLNDDVLVIAVYQVADLIEPGVKKWKDRQEINPKVNAFIKLISETVDHLAMKEERAKSDAQVTFHSSTLSMVIRAPQSVHRKLETVLDQMRQQRNQQIHFAITIATVPAEIANTWDVGKIWTDQELKRRLGKAAQNEKFKVLMSPALVILDDQSGSINVGELQVGVRGSFTEDQHSIRTELSFGDRDDAPAANYKLWTSSKVIPEGRACVFFIKSEDALSPQLDRRLLIEKGIDVAPSDANQLFAFVIPNTVRRLEEEELLGLPEKGIYSTKPPWARQPVPTSPADTSHATLPFWPPAYVNKYAYMPPEEYFQKQPKLDWDGWNWEPNLDAVNKNGQRVIDAWDLNMPSQAIRYRKEAEKRIPDINPLPTRRRE